VQRRPFSITTDFVAAVMDDGGIVSMTWRLVIAH
jgi:hypothetical protein